MTMITYLSSFIEKYRNNKKFLFFGLTLLTGVTLLWPFLDFQYYIAQGDHGRDLYCFKKILDGAIPYRDFSWLFGPLMPYYYSAFYVLGGVSIQSVLLGQFILILLIGLVIYSTCVIFIPPAMSFLCVFWYWSFRGSEFFYTYNHSGGLLALFIALYCAFQYIQKQKNIHVYAGFISIFLLCLIRLNIGISTLIAFVFSLMLTDFVQKAPDASRKRKLYFLYSFTLLIVISAIYWYLLHPLTNYEIHQSFPYGKSQRTDHTASVLTSIVYSWQLIISYFTSTLAQKFFGILLFFSLVQTSILLFTNKLPKILKKNLILVFITLSSFIVMSSHEFIASGVFYRLFWFFPMLYIAVFLIVSTATQNLSSKFIRFLILLTLFLPSLLNSWNDFRIIQSHKKPHHMLQIGNTKVYTTQRPSWFQAVTNASRFISANVPPTDSILVLPLDPLYLFLAERNSASRQLVFFEHFNIPQEQEQKVIVEMKHNNGNWVVLSNRAISLEKGLGVFGKDYCPLLSKYIEEHFVVVAQFGDWVNPPGWAWNHGVRILKRVK